MVAPSVTKVKDFVVKSYPKSRQYAQPLRHISAYFGSHARQCPSIGACEQMPWYLEFQREAEKELDGPRQRDFGVDL